MPDTLNSHRPAQLDEPHGDLSPAASTSSGDDWSYATRELLDTLPRAWTRGLLYFLIMFVSIALPWAAVFKVDETGTARGRLEPQEKTVKLDSPVEGVVAAIKVKVGDSVKAGQTLMELDSKLASAELQQIQTKLEGQETRKNNLEMLKKQLASALDTQKRQNESQKLEKFAQVEQARQNLNSLKTTYNLQKEEKMAQVNQARQALESLQSTYNLQKEEKMAQVSQARQAVESSKAAYNLVKIGWEGAKQKVEDYTPAFQAGAISRDRFNEVEQLVKENSERLVQAESEISQAESRLQEQQGSYDKMIQQLLSDIEQAKLRLKEQENSYQKIVQQADSDIEQAQLRVKEQESSYQSLVEAGEMAVLNSEKQVKEHDAQIADTQSEMAQMENQAKALKVQLSQRSIKSTINGIIFQLPVEKAGAVVQPGKMIAEIAPEGAMLLLRSQITTAESGFL